MSEYSTSDLKWTSVREFRPVGTGEFYRTTRGTLKEKLIAREFVRTAAAGVLELDEWCRLMEQAVEREDRTDLLDRIVEHCRSHCAWLRKEKELREYALECLSSGACMAWDDFKEVA